MRNPVTTKLYALLADEHAALLAGRLDDVVRWTNDKERLLERLADQNVPSEELTALSDAIARNQTLLSAAIRGVKAAERSLSDAYDTNAGTNVYGADGQVSRLRAPGHGVSQKL